MMMRGRPGHGTTEARRGLRVELALDALQAQVIVADKAVEAVGARVADAAHMSAPIALAVELKKRWK